MARRKILVVDDDPELQKIIKKNLEPKGFIVEGALDGLEALEKINLSPPDLIILDLIMPKMSGLKCLEKIRKIPKTEHLPIIILSARDKVEDKIRGLDLGADDYLTKPFSLGELTARCLRLLQRVEKTIHRNPLTHLPGFIAFEEKVNERLKGGKQVAIVYLDIDHFKSYNDTYGLKKGDEVILKTARIIEEAVRSKGNEDDFICHVGGDDFIFISTPEKAKPISERIIKLFDRTIPLYYDERARRDGYIITLDRNLIPHRFSLMTVSLCIITNERRNLAHIGEVSLIAAQLKKYAKSFPYSVWVKERRAG
jgi:PleD family two-component response regulator